LSSDIHHYSIYVSLKGMLKDHLDGSYKWAATSIIASREETTEKGASLGQLCLQQDHSYLSGDSN